MQASDALLSAVAQVNMLDLSGRVISNPERNALSVTAAEVLALAMAMEGLWAITLEADLLVRAIRMPITGNDERDAARDAAVQHQTDEVSRLMAAIRGEIQTQPQTGE